MDIALALLKLLLVLLWIALLPVILLIATPFVLWWPRRKSSRSYIETVLRRYWMVICLSALAGGEALDVDVDVDDK
jgi:hypothetical protein